MSHKPHDGKPVSPASPAAAFAAKIAAEEGQKVDPKLVQGGEARTPLSALERERANKDSPCQSR